MVLTRTILNSTKTKEGLSDGDLYPQTKGFDLLFGKLWYSKVDNSTDSGGLPTWAGILSLPLLCDVTVGKSVNLSVRRL